MSKNVRHDKPIYEPADRPNAEPAPLNEKLIKQLQEAVSKARQKRAPDPRAPE